MSYANDWNQGPDSNPNPYAAPASVIEDDFGLEYQPWAGRTLATRGSRLVANIVDGLAFGVTIIPASIMLGISGGDFSSMVFVATGVSGLLFLGLAIYNLMRLHSHQQTLGKQAMGLQIIRGDLQTPVTLGRIIGLRIIPIACINAIPLVGGLIGGLVDPLMIFQETQQCLHDMIADTNVVLYEA